MEKKELEAILDKLIAGLEEYASGDYDADTYYVDELLKDLGFEPGDELYDETYGMDEQEFAKQAIEYDDLGDKMRRFVKLLVDINGDYPLYRDFDEDLYAGNFIAYELALKNSGDLDLFGDYIEFFPLYEYDTQPIFGEITNLRDKWGKEKAALILENLRNSRNADDLFEDEDYDEDENEGEDY